MDLNKLPLAPAYAIYHPDSTKWDEGTLPEAIRLPMTSGVLVGHPQVSGWTFRGRENFELTRLGVLARGLGPYLDVLPPSELPDLVLEFEARGADPSQRVRVKWSSHRGEIARRVTHECGARVDGLCDFTEVLTLFCRTRIFGNGTCRDFSFGPGPWGCAVANAYNSRPEHHPALAYPGKVREAFAESASQLESAVEKLDTFTCRNFPDAPDQIRSIKERVQNWREMAASNASAVA